jgi:hypothetical protein
MRAFSKDLKNFEKLKKPGNCRAAVKVENVYTCPSEIA